MPNGKAKYSIDSSSLIHAWRRAYPPEHFKTFWQRLEELVNSGVIVASIEVLNELKKRMMNYGLGQQSKTLLYSLKLMMSNKITLPISWEPIQD